MVRSVSRMRSLPAIGQPFEHGADGLGGIHYHLVGMMRLFEGSFRILVTEQPGDREEGLAPSQGDAGMGVAEIVKANTAQPGFGADPVPETFKPALGPRPRGAGNTHCAVRSSPSRTVRAGRDSQTVRGPVLLSRRKRCPSR